jgi:hypothetical protein
MLLDQAAFEKWIDSKLNRRYRPQLFSKGVAVEYYITKVQSRRDGWRFRG